MMARSLAWITVLWALCLQESLQQHFKNILRDPQAGIIITSSPPALGSYREQINDGSWKQHDCFYTDSSSKAEAEGDPYVQMTLRKQETIHKITIYACDDYPLGNVTVTIDGQAVATTGLLSGGGSSNNSSGGEPSRVTNITRPGGGGAGGGGGGGVRSSLWRGRTVRLSLNPAGPTSQVLAVAEVAIWVCDPTHYGDYCERACGDGCRGDGTCDSQTGLCTLWTPGAGCKEGYQPTEKCDQGCWEGRYGEGCRKRCGQGCKLGICDSQTGLCTCRSEGWADGKCDECAEGYYVDYGYPGECRRCSEGCRTGTCRPHSNGICQCLPGWRRNGGKCDRRCWEGRYGEGCRKRCGQGCKFGTCDSQTGLCTCRSEGWADGKCDVCKPGYYKWSPFNRPHCKQCSEGCQDTCDTTDGRCTCKPGWSGYRCEVCKAGQYGSSCDGRCSKGCQDTCDTTDGRCTCKPGWSGYRCEECEDGYYGDQCVETCGLCAGNRPCDRKTGRCHRCQGSQQMPFCKTMCKAGQYGSSCDGRCSKGCQDTCDTTDGRCTCKPGWSGYRCEECEDGYYGDQCAETCGLCAGNRPCDRKTGRCHRCQGSQQMPFCKTMCKAGQYGSSCDGRCSKGCQDTCDTTDGRCTCKPGWSGYRCEECEDGYYGDQCAETCGLCAGNRPCDRKTGRCHRCQGSQQMPFCKTMCKAGQYGSSCDGRCSKGCQDTCDTTDGRCTCKPGWSGNRCEVCKAGQYGPSCNGRCSKGCQDTCDTTDGRCTCKPGWSGDKCEVEASDGGHEKWHVTVAILTTLVVALLALLAVSLYRMHRAKRVSGAEEGTRIGSTQTGTDAVGEVVTEQERRGRPDTRRLPLPVREVDEEEEGEEEGHYTEVNSLASSSRSGDSRRNVPRSIAPTPVSSSAAAAAAAAAASPASPSRDNRFGSGFKKTKARLSLFFKNTGAPTKQRLCRRGRRTHAVQTDPGYEYDDPEEGRRGRRTPWGDPCEERAVSQDPSCTPEGYLILLNTDEGDRRTSNTTNTNTTISATSATNATTTTTTTTTRGNRGVGRSALLPPVLATGGKRRVEREQPSPHHNPPRRPPPPRLPIQETPAEPAPAELGGAEEEEEKEEEAPSILQSFDLASIFSSDPAARLDADDDPREEARFIDDPRQGTYDRPAVYSNTNEDRHVYKKLE
ncbi:uncharacterized protein LOC143285136 [Babylonia areolata]|uniref:uncharacterized protein LOC143285136 n=1 Tax=Babylonia areolata TaxID=304850 RepID=UPI003FD68D80